MGAGKIFKWYGTSTDIEDRKRAEQLQSDLAHVNRVTTLGELTASLAHEIKQPISATILNANTCLRWLKRESQTLTKYVRQPTSIAEDGNRAADIIDRLRSLYKKAPPKREFVDVNEIVREMVVLMRGEANEYAVSIRTDLSTGVPTITADRVQLQQVLMNLMLNGIEAMKETGGILTVKSQLTRMAKCRSQSLIPVWGCQPKRPIKSSTLSSPQRRRDPAWAWRSVGPLSKRMAAVCGPRPTTVGAPRFISHCRSPLRK